MPFILHNKRYIPRIDTYTPNGCQRCEDILWYLRSNRKSTASDILKGIDERTEQDSEKTDTPNNAGCILALYLGGYIHEDSMPNQPPTYDISPHGIVWLREYSKQQTKGYYEICATTTHQSPL